ncbi:MAG TPA: hypothetical protein VJQ45_02000, partial [Ktedonobacterales bacterium]|nr:hypothetical protein [Ktedonobacterales bacterium]
MQADDLAKLREDLEHELLRGARGVAILGLTDVALRLVDALASIGLVEQVMGIFTPPGHEPPNLRVPVLPVDRLDQHRPDV